jgi:hypothetical protein
MDKELMEAKAAVEEFARFQDSQGTPKAYLAETAEMAYTGRNEKGEWGLALSSAAQGSLIDIVGASFFPLYKVVGPMIFFLSLMLIDAAGVGRVTANGYSPGEGGGNSKIQGVWDLGVDSPMGNLVPAGDLAVQLDGRGHGRSWHTSQADDGDRSCPGSGGGEAKEEKSEHGGPQKEVLVVAERGGKKEQPAPLIDVEAGEDNGVALRGIRSTKL